MRKYLLVLLFNFVIYNSYAQESAWAYWNNMTDSSEHYVFSDTAFIRNTPSTQSAVLDTLLTGHDVLLLNKTNIMLLVRGFTAPWVKISYKKAGQEKSGFVWSGMLSFNPMRRGNTKFVFGFNSRSKDKNGLNYYSGFLKVVESGKLTEKTPFKIVDGESLSFIEGTVQEPGGLDSVRYVIQLFFSGEACGVDAYNYSFAWTGKKLVNMPPLVNNGDADIYMHSESYVFPNDKGGQPTILIVDIEQMEQTEKPDGKGNYLYSFTGQKKFFKWNGSQFKLVNSLSKKKQLKPIDH